MRLLFDLWVISISARRRFPEILKHFVRRTKYITRRKPNITRCRRISHFRVSGNISLIKELTHGQFLDALVSVKPVFSRLYIDGQRDGKRNGIFHDAFEDSLDLVHAVAVTFDDQLVVYLQNQTRIKSERP